VKGSAARIPTTERERSRDEQTAHRRVETHRHELNEDKRTGRCQRADEPPHRRTLVRVRLVNVG